MKKKSFISKTHELIQAGDRFIRKNGISKFHLEAQKLLLEAHLPELFDFNELVKYSFSKGIPENQNFKFLEFSDLPITLARGKYCFIDLYYWRRRPTTIHNHHFVGAFQCIMGNNVDCSYTFKTSKKHSRYHSEGTLQLNQERFIKTGDVQTIDFQDKFIHQNHHQCDLTLNLTFRTPDVPFKNLSNFYYSGLKFEKSQRSIIRSERLINLATFSEVNLSKINYTLEDAFNFVLLTQNRGLHPAVKNIRMAMLSKVKSLSKLDLEEVMDRHEAELDRMIGQYE